ncbi:pyridoxal phosphate-dependent transferase [Aspergillus crustosus]
MSSLFEKATDHLHASQQLYEAANAKSRLQHEEATMSLPGGNTRSVLHASPFPLCMAFGRGNHLTDVDGHEYLDCIGDMTAGLYGHSEPLIAQTITSTLTNIGMNLGATTIAEARLAEAICQRFVSIEQLRFCNSGTEANLYALSVARLATGRPKVIVFEGGYHGGVLSFANGIALNNVDKADWIVGRYNDVGHVKELISNNKDVAAAVLVEGMQGAGGCIPGTPEFLHAVQQAAKENNIIFILDEVMTSRLAPGGLQSYILHPEHRNPLSPDLTTIGKWVGGGLSIGAFGGRSDLMGVYDPRSSKISHSGTFNNNTLAMNVGYEAMKNLYTPDACLALNGLGDELRQDLNTLAQGTRMAVTGMGALMTIHFLPTGDPTQVLRKNDLTVDTESVEAVLRDLFWFFLIKRGIWIARRGMLSLILGTSREDTHCIKEVVRAFLGEFRELVAL